MKSKVIAKNAKTGELLGQTEAFEDLNYLKKATYKLKEDLEKKHPNVVIDYSVIGGK